MAELSPEAQAIWDAFNEGKSLTGALAAALREVVNQMPANYPQSINQIKDPSTKRWSKFGCVTQRHEDRTLLVAIAYELENHHES
jgi:hypothetical protein